MSVPLGQQGIWWGGAALALLLGTWLLGQPIRAFLLGAGIAYMLDPLADRLQRIGLSRTMSGVVITAGAVLLLAAVILLIVPVLLRQAASLIETAPEMLDQARAFVSAH